MRLKTQLGLAALALIVVGGATIAGLASGRDQATQEAQRVGRPLGPPPTLDQRIALLQAKAAAAPSNAPAHVNLGFAYLQKARESGDPSFYGKAESVLQTAAKLDPDDADPLIGLGTLALSRHEFEQGLLHGLRARDLNPYKAAAYSVIADAQVELGRYDEARESVQQMVNLRPDLTSYSRVSYVRELFGDFPGAIEAMRQAVEAGGPGSEALAWTRVQLGHLLFNTGELAAAQREYDRTLYEYPDYVHARAGQARVLAARGDFAGAATLYQQITATMPLPEYVIALADVYHAAGRADEAVRADALVLVLDRLYRENGVKTDVEMALFAADRGIAPAETVERAREALALRPGIHAWDALAWALYQSGSYEEALAASDQALRLGSRDSLMRFHAGLIALKLGQNERAARELRAALSQNPHFSVRHGEDARVTLARLATGT